MINLTSVTLGVIGLGALIWLGLLQHQRACVHSFNAWARVDLRLRSETERQAHRERIVIDDAWPDLDAEQQTDLADSVETMAAQHNRQQESPSSSPVQQDFQLRIFVGNIYSAARAGLRRASKKVFGDAEGGPVRVVEQILDWLVLGLGDEPTSHAGRMMRQLLAAAWLMLCVLMLTNFAQADRVAGASWAWSVVYGSLGLFYLILWSILVIGFVRERRAWARS